MSFNIMIAVSRSFISLRHWRNLSILIVAMLAGCADSPGELSEPGQTSPIVADGDLVYRAVPREIEMTPAGKLTVDVQLTNNSDRTIFVYWGDYAWPAMYDFQITHKETKRRITTSRVSL